MGDNGKQLSTSSIGCGDLNELLLASFCVCSLSCVRLLGTPWTGACQALLPIGFSRQEYWSGLPFPTPDVPDPGIKLASLALAGRFFTTEAPRKSRHSLGEFQIHSFHHPQNLVTTQYWRVTILRAFLTREVYWIFVVQSFIEGSLYRQAWLSPNKDMPITWQIPRVRS